MTLPKSNPQIVPGSFSPERQGTGRRHDDIRNEQLSVLISQIPDGIACISRDWRVTYANPVAMRLLRLAPGQIEIEPFWGLFPHIIGTPLEGAYRSVMASGVPTHLEHYSRRSDIWLDIHILPVAEGIAAYFRDITDRKGAELLRDAASHRLLQVLEATTDAVISINRDNIFTFLNRRASELLAVKGDLIGKNVWMEFPFAKEQGQYQYFFRRAMHEDVPGEFEDFYPEPLNKWLSFQVRPSEEGIVIFFRDVTDRKRNEEALTASETRYRILADLNPQAIWMGAPDGSLTYANQGLLDYLGFTDEDLKEETWLKAFHHDDHQGVLDTWSHSIATGADYEIEARMIRAADSRARWFSVRAQPVRDDTGNILHWLGVNIDIDDRKTFAERLQQKQEETERQRAELETIYRTAPVGLALFDPIELRYLRVNDHQVETIGVPREKIIGRRITELAPLKGIEDIFRQVAAGNSIRNHIFEGELPSRPGEYRYWNCNYSPVRNADGQVEAIAAVIQEITHQKKAEQALVQSEKLAAVGRLASSISHEINNPLEAITNLLYLIGESEDLPASIKEYVLTTQSELSRVCQIATQTLRFHRQAVSATYVTARDLVEAVLNLYQGRLANSGITVETHFATSKQILCLENDIRQVLNNLIANAIDAMRRGGRLLVRAHDATDLVHAGLRKGIRITIADTGHGMSPAVRSRIFEPFYTTKELNGTGLGLWISMGIVDRHHGRLTLRSTQHPVHHGTIFSLFLPCLDEVENTEQEDLPSEY